MKLIKAIIKPFKLEEVKEALSDLGVEGITISEVRGHGKQKGDMEIFSGREFSVDYFPKVMIEIALLDEDVQKVVDTICRIAKTGKIGDGKIFILPLENAIRVRTGEQGEMVL